MDSGSKFQPDWVSAPGETMIDILTEKGITIVEFSQRIGLNQKMTEDLLSGRMMITIGMARKLTKILEGSVEFWMARDFQYQEDLRVANANSLNS